MIMAVMGRIPAYITIRLGKVAVTFAVSNAILFVFTDTLFRVSLIDKKYYHYFINYQSTVLKKNETYHMDLMSINELKYQEYIKRGVWNRYREALEFDMLDTWYLCMIKMLVYRYDEEVSYDYFINLKARINELIPDARYNKYIEANFTDMQKMLVELINYDVSKEQYNKIEMIIKKIGI